jgi:hypothetical protein
MKQTGKLPKQLVKFISDNEAWEWLPVDNQPKIVSKGKLSELMVCDNYTEEEQDLIRDLIFNNKVVYDLYEEF